MKDAHVIFFFILLFGTFQSSKANSCSSKDDKTISLKKDTSFPLPRTPLLETITAEYSTENLTVNSSNYTGIIQIEIMGNDGFTYSYSVSDAHSEYIDISTLQSGSYTIIISTASTIYTGDFEL
ncbi:MAG: DUF3244 domain-containing protein [Paludibacter sp.]|nr:DUF3244 domain-containing protein [Paludibacter sp.]